MKAWEDCWQGARDLDDEAPELTLKSLIAGFKMVDSRRCRGTSCLQNQKQVSATKVLMTCCEI